MKKLILIMTTVFILAFVLCACNGENPASTQTSSELTQDSESAPTQSTTEQAILTVEEAKDILRRHYDSDEPIEHLSEYDKLVDGVKLYCFAFPGDVFELEFVNSVTGELTQESVPWLDEMLEHWEQGQGSNESNQENATSITLTLFADFPGETWTKDTQPLPIGNMPASQPAIVYYLSDEMSEWTGFNFSINGASFGENSVTVDWSSDSTLIAGSDGSNRHEYFGVLEGAWLNWFIMDSFAMTLKNNLDVTTVYFSSNGGPVTFSNPWEMAEYGLPELPANQSYEGSTFFINHAGGRGGMFDSDPGGAVEHEWWGQYTGDGFSLGITNFDGTSFWFTFYNLRNGESFFDGVAAVIPGNSYVAEYENMLFNISHDYSSIYVNIMGQSEWEHLIGHYHRVD